MNSPYSGIPELADLESGQGLLRVPMLQDVPFTRRVRALVDTAEFQRLRQITQLGLTSCVYPGTTHTRFEHALGVYHNALRYLRQLGRDPRFVSAVDVHQAEVLIVAALLHDLGHWPFCHPIEEMSLPELPPHEVFAAEFLVPGRELAQVLSDEWDIKPDEVLDLLVAGTDTPTVRLLRSILSGPIDIDKMDYLERDSLHAGVPYGRHFDKNRVIHSFMVNEAGDGLAISTKGKTAAELMVFARYVMFSEVYWHHAVRSATSMFARAFYELHRELDLQAFFRSSETETIRTLRQRAQGTDCATLLEGIFGPKRVLYKRVCEFSFSQAPDIYQAIARQPYQFLVQCCHQLADRLSNDLRETVKSTEILIDAPPPDREVEFDVQVYDAKQKVYWPLQTVSPVIDALAHTQFDDYVKRVRLFAHPRLSVRLAELPNLIERLHETVAKERL